ncbi:MAG: MMPL family transporter [Thermoplasmatota archaeon]
MTSTLGRITRWSARNRVGVLAITAVAMLLLGGGILQLEFRDRPEDAMPKGNPHSEASEALLREFPGASYTNAIVIEATPSKWAAANDRLQFRVPLDSPEAGGTQDELSGLLEDLLQQGSQGQAPPGPDPFPGPLNITDEVYMRGMEELFLFLTDQVPEMKWGITLPSQVKLVNYTNTGVPNPVPGGEPLVFPDSDAFSMPGYTTPEGAAQFSTGWTSYWYASLDSIKTIVSLDWGATRFGLLFEPGDLTLNEAGAAVYDAVEAYRDEVRICDGDLPGQCSLEWNVFSPDAITVDPRAPANGAAYLTKVTVEDLTRLAPFVAVFIGLSLFVAFRRVGIVAAMLLPMGLAGIGVLGTFGLIDLPIHSVSLLVFPILMGNGIDFAIHMANGYNQARARGDSVEDAAYQAGVTAGTPLFIATMTTLTGMMLLIFAPNNLITQLGLAILLGMVLLLAVSLTALPAALTWTKPVNLGNNVLGRILHRNAAFWNRNRIMAIAFVALLAGGSVLAAGGTFGRQLETLIIGTPAAYYPPGDAQREDFEHTNEAFFAGKEDLVTNSLVIRGDIATVQGMEVLKRLEEEIPQLPFVQRESAVSLYFALNAWIQVRGGTAGAPAVIAQETVEPGSTFPTTDEGVKFLVDEMFATPLATYATFFIDHPEYQISNMLVEIKQTDDLDQLERDWNALLAVVDEVMREVPGHDLQIHVAGGTSLGYLFAKEELPYVQVASLIGLALTGFLVLAIRRSPRDAVTVAGVVGGSGLLWLGVLYLLDIPLSIALVVPVVMIAAIGSDYALHLRYSLQHHGPGAWGDVGRAVFFSAVTDLGAFAIFTQMRYGILSDATLATVGALFACLVTTLILVPALAAPKEIGTP